MTDKNLPSPELLRKLLRYEPDTGKLYWRKRTSDMFVDGERSAESSCKAWNNRFANTEAFTSFRVEYPRGTIFNRTYSAHRVIWAICNGVWPLDQIDHINGIKDDNRIENLRSVSRSENQKNRKLTKTNKSGAMGVCWHKAGGKWRAEIKVNNITKHIGYFDNKSDAISARKDAEIKYGFHENHGRKI